MAVSEQIKGLPSLTAVVVVLTGITGAVMGDVILNKLRIKDEMARGLAFGIAAHGIHRNSPCDSGKSGCRCFRRSCNGTQRTFYGYSASRNHNFIY